MGSKIFPKKYTFVSHYIMVILSLNSYIRSIVFPSLTLKHFLEYVSTRYYVLIRIDDGTSDVLDHTDFFILHSFVILFRPVFPTDSVASHRSILMVTQDGKPFTDIQKIISQFQKKHIEILLLKPPHQLRLTRLVSWWI